MRVRAPEGGRDAVGGSGAPWEVRGPRLFGLSAPFSGARGVTGPFPSKEWVRGRWPGEKGSGPRGSGCLGRQCVVKDNYEALA